MAYAYVHDIAASWPEYRRLAVPTHRGAPPGLLLEAAGPIDEGVRVIGVWRREADWLTYGRDRHMRAVDALERLGDARLSFRDVPAVLLLAGELIDRRRRPPE